MQQRRGPSSRPRTRRRASANRWLAALTVVFVLIAVGCGALAYITWQDANDVRAATKPLEARTAQLHADQSAADVAIDRLTAVFGAIRAQSEATATAVGTANQAAQRFNNAQAGIADALGGDVANVGASLTQSTAAVRTAVDRARDVLHDFANVTEDPAHG
jgi:hypothetical protein